MPVIVAVTMCAAVPVGPAFRIERRGDRCQATAKPGNHVLDHVIAADPERFAQQLRWQMPVAEMPGDLDEMGRVARGDFDQILRFGQHFDNPAIFQLQPVAMMQKDGVSFIEQKGQAAFPAHDRASAMPVLPVEDDPVDGAVLRVVLGPIACRMDLANADHVASANFAFMDWYAGRSLRRLK